MKTYSATRYAANVIVHEDGKAQRDLNPRLDLMRLSPTGYGWGSDRQSARQLALALLCDALEDDQRALALYLDYTREHIAKLNRGAGIMLTSGTIRLDARLIEDRKGREP